MSSVRLRRPLAGWEPVVTGSRLPRLHASRGQRSRMGKGRSRLWKQGSRALVMDIGAPLSRSAFPNEWIVSYSNWRVRTIMYHFPPSPAVDAVTIQGAGTGPPAALAGGLPHLSARARDTTDGDGGACGA